MLLQQLDREVSLTGGDEQVRPFDVGLDHGTPRRRIGRRFVDLSSSASSAIDSSTCRTDDGLWCQAATRTPPVPGRRWRSGLPLVDEMWFVVPLWRIPLRITLNASSIWSS